MPQGLAVSRQDPAAAHRVVHLDSELWIRLRLRALYEGETTDEMAARLLSVALHSSATVGATEKR